MSSSWFCRFLSLCLFNRKLPLLCLILTTSGVQINPKFCFFEERWHLVFFQHGGTHGGSCWAGGIPAGTEMAGDYGKSLGRMAEETTPYPIPIWARGRCGRHLIVFSSFALRQKDNLHMQRIGFLSVSYPWL